MAFPTLLSSFLSVAALAQSGFVPDPPPVESKPAPSVSRMIASIGEGLQALKFAPNPGSSECSDKAVVAGVDNSAAATHIGTTGGDLSFNCDEKDDKVFEKESVSRVGKEGVAKYPYTIGADDSGSFAAQCNSKESRCVVVFKSKKMDSNIKTSPEDEQPKCLPKGFYMGVIEKPGKTQSQTRKGEYAYKKQRFDHLDVSVDKESGLCNQGAQDGGLDSTVKVLNLGTINSKEREEMDIDKICEKLGWNAGMITRAYNER